MKTIQLTNNQAQNLYFLAQKDMYDLISAPSSERTKKRLMWELDKIGGFETDYCGKPDKSADPYKNKNVKPILILYPEVKKWLKRETRDNYYSNGTDWNGAKISLTNLLKKLKK